MTIGCIDSTSIYSSCWAWPSAQDARPRAGRKKLLKRAIAFLRLHLEVSPDNGDKSGVVARRTTNFVSGERGQSCLFWTRTISAGLSVVDDGMGDSRFGFNSTVRVQWLLEQYTIANKGRRIGIFAELEDFRWLARRHHQRHLGRSVDLYSRCKPRGNR